MGLVYKPSDGYDAALMHEIRKALDSLWTEYQEDCRASDTRPCIVDFCVWAIHVKGFKDGLAFARDDADDPQET